MIKTKKTLAELEMIARTALRSGGAIVEKIAIAPSSSGASDANWTLLYIDSARALDPKFIQLIRPIQARYDLAW
jgi:hypothetical protein